VQPSASLADRRLDVWARENASWIDESLVKHGAILFRGFEAHSAEDFERAAGTLGQRLISYVGGTASRTRVTNDVYTTTEAPPYVPIPLHCEMSYLDQYPRRIMFYCSVPPTARGQTPLADMAAVYHDLDSRVRDRIEERGLLYIQNLPSNGTAARGKTWQEMFGLNREEVEAFCLQHGIKARWRENDTLQLLSRRPPSIVQPASGQRVWFNQLTVFHDSFSWELANQKQRIRALFARRNERRRARSVAPLDRRNHYLYADGTEIPIEDVQHVRKTSWKHATYFDWQPADVMVVDNLRIAHGRMPFKGPRRIFAALGEPVTAATATA
jgi:alpha-ketoglutarate-dependent taurine dioxygenase